MMYIFFWLLWGHALADYPLQGHSLADGKRRKGNENKSTPWWMALFFHSLIHAGFVFYITASPWLAAAELAAHALIDFTKCETGFGLYSSRGRHIVDQTLHVLCKVLWLVLLSRGIG